MQRGRGHVEHAQRLADAHGDDPTRWEDVACRLMQLSKQEYHAHPVVRHGCCRGPQRVRYVQTIVERFGHYKPFVAAAGLAAGPAPPLAVSR